MRSYLTVQGHSGYLAVPIFLIPALAFVAFFYFSDNLPEFCLTNANMVLLTIGGVVAVLLLMAAYLRTRRLQLQNGMLSYVSWFRRTAFGVAVITDMTVETEAAVSSDSAPYTSHHLTFWRGDEELLRLNLDYWRGEPLRQLVHQLVQMNPAIKSDRDVRRYAEQPD